MQKIYFLFMKVEINRTIKSYQLCGGENMKIIQDKQANK